MSSFRLVTSRALLFVLLTNNFLFVFTNKPKKKKENTLLFFLAIMRLKIAPDKGKLTHILTQCLPVQRTLITSINFDIKEKRRNFLFQYS